MVRTCLTYSPFDSAPPLRTQSLLRKGSGSCVQSPEAGCPRCGEAQCPRSEVPHQLSPRALPKAASIQFARVTVTTDGSGCCLATRGPGRTSPVFVIVNAARSSWACRNPRS